MQQPCQGELRDGCAMGFGRGVELAARLRQFARCYWKPGDEAEFVLRAIFDDVFVLAVAEVVLILHADDLDYLSRLIDLVRLYLAQAYVADLALFLQLFDRAEGFLDRYPGVDAVQLPQVDSFQLQAAEAH